MSETKEYVSELTKWAEKDGINHRLSTLLLNTALRLTLLERQLERREKLTPKGAKAHG